jgi:hypothetical protein
MEAVETSVYYLGYIVALFLHRGLGRLFFIPMLINLGFDLALQFDFLRGWDIRLVMVGYGFLFFVWVSALAGMFDRVTVVVLVVVDVLVAARGILPNVQTAGVGSEFWNATSTTIFEIWLLSVLLVSLSVILKSSVVSLMERGYSELLTLPKARFLIPVAAWSATWVLPTYVPFLRELLGGYQSRVAGQLLVWGWVAFEFPFYRMYQHMPEDDG